jgi:uncharacterized Zn-binding protein involved in type VI secretion
LVPEAELYEALKTGKPVSRTIEDEGPVYDCVHAKVSVDMKFEPSPCESEGKARPGAVAFSGVCTDDGARIIAKQSGVFINGKPVARIGDKAFSPVHGMTEIAGKETCKVFVRGRPIARVGDPTTGGGKIVGGSPDVLATQK